MSNTRHFGCKVAVIVASVALAEGCADKAPMPLPKVAATVSDSMHVSAPASTSTNENHWIGQRYSDIPDSVFNYGGDTIIVADSVFSVRHIGSHGQELLWFARGRGKGPSGAAEWTILATVPLSIVGEERVFFDCRRDKKRDPRIIALGLYDDGPWFTRIHRAWRPNIAARSFDEISIAGIDCRNSDGGE